MNQSATLRRRLNLLACSVLAWMAAYAPAWVHAAEKEGGGAGKSQMYLASYTVVVLCIGLGVFFVCASSRRRDRAKGSVLEGALSAPSLIKKEAGVPVITVGMRIDQINKVLGKPKVSRRGDDIYRELAQAGKLSEEDAAKEHTIYEHPAGRYELVFLERRVVEVKSQPSTPKAE